MKSTQCGWRSFAIVGLSVLGVATVAGAADGARARTAEEIQAKLPAGNLLGDPDLRGPDNNWRDTSLAPPPINLHPPRFDACLKYTDPAKFDTDNPGLASFEDYVSTVPGHTPSNGGYIFGCSGWASRGPGQSACWGATDIVAGIQAREFPPTRANSGLAQYGSGFQGSSSQGVVANFFVDSWGVWFNDPMGHADINKPSAVKTAKLTSFFGADANVRNHFVLSDGREINVIGSSSPAGVFFGACCDTTIDVIDVFSAGGQAEGWDDVSFGAKTTCVLPEAPVTLEDLHVGQEILGQMLEAIETKLDTFQCSGGGGGTR